MAQVESRASFSVNIYSDPFHRVSVDVAGMWR